MPDWNSSASNPWILREYKKAAYYARDVLLGSLISFSDFHTVEGRPCDKQIATLNHMPYNVYRFRDYTLLIPADLGSSFSNVIRFGGDQYGFHYSVLNKQDSTLELTEYRFSSNALMGVRFTKTLLHCTVEEEKFQKNLQGINAEELFFSSKRYMSFFQDDPNTTEKMVEIIKKPDSTVANVEDVTDMQAMLFRVMADKVKYKPVADSEAPLFEIADSFDIQNAK